MVLLQRGRSSVGIVAKAYCPRSRPLQPRLHIGVPRAMKNLIETAVENGDHLIDLLASDDERRPECDPVRVEPAQKPVLERSLADLHAERGVGGERLPGRAVADELHPLEQSLAAQVAD